MKLTYCSGNWEDCITGNISRLRLVSSLGKVSLFSFLEVRSELIWGYLTKYWNSFLKCWSTPLRHRKRWSIFWWWLRHWVAVLVFINSDIRLKSLLALRYLLWKAVFLLTSRNLKYSRRSWTFQAPIWFISSDISANSALDLSSFICGFSTASGDAISLASEKFPSGLSSLFF